MRQGATKVTVVSSEKGEKLPAHQWEIDEAKEEGILFEEGYWKEFKEEENVFLAVEKVKDSINLICIKEKHI